MSADAEGMLGATARFVAESDWQAATGAIEYIRAMVAGQASAETIDEWCYEFAAAGINYRDWPDMVIARVEGGVPTDPELGALRRDALANSLVDYGEIETIRRRGEPGTWG